MLENQMIPLIPDSTEEVQMIPGGALQEIVDSERYTDDQMNLHGLLTTLSKKQFSPDKDFDSEQFLKDLNTNTYDIYNGKETVVRENLSSLRAIKDLKIKTDILNENINSFNTIDEQSKADTISLSTLPVNPIDPSTVLERESVNTLSDMNNLDETASIVQSEQGERRDFILDSLANTMQLNKYINEYRKKSKDQSVFDTATNFVGRVFGIQDTRASDTLVKLAKELNLPKSSYTFEWNGRLHESGSRASIALYQELQAKNPEEYKKFIETVLIPKISDTISLFSDKSKNYSVIADTLEKLKYTTGSDLEVDTLNEFVDKASLVSDAATLGTAAVILAPVEGITNVVTGILKRTGNRGLAAKAILTSVDNPEVLNHLIKPLEAAEEILPSALKSTGVKDTSLSGQVLSEIELNNKLVQKVKPILDDLPSQITPEERQDLIKRTAENLIKDDTKNIVHDFDIIKSSDTLGGQDLLLKVGKQGHKGGFATKESANKSTKRLLNEPNFSSIEIKEDSTGQWFIHGKTPIPSDEWTKPILFENLAGANPISRRLLTDSATQTEWVQGMSVLLGGQTQVIKSILGSEIKNLKYLGKGGIEKLKIAVFDGLDKEKWFSDLELKSLHKFTDKELAAYKDFKSLSDFEFYVRNRVAKSELVGKGYKEGSIELNNKVSKVYLREKKELPKDVSRVFDYSSSTWYRHGELSPKEITSKLDTDYKLYELSSPISSPNNDPYKFIISKGSDLKIKGLPFDVIGYRAGGHINYVGKYFVKQSIAGTFSDTGTRYLKQPITHIVSETPQGAKAYAKAMEEARDVYNRYKKGVLNRKEASKLLAESPIGSLEDFEKRVLEGRINTETPFEVVLDGEHPRAYDTLRGHIANKEDDFIQKDYYYPEGFNSPRGDRLKDPTGELAAIQDPKTLTNGAINQVLKSGLWSEYRNTAIERWVKTVDNFNLFDDLSKAGTIEDKFYNGVLKKSKDPKVNQMVSKAETQRDAMGRLFKFKTKTELTLDQTKLNIIDSFANSKLGGTVFGKKATKTVIDILSSNPINAIKSLTFDATLGTFNPLQLARQTQTALAARAISPIHGLKSIPHAIPMGWALANGNESVIDFIAKSFSKVGGLTEKQFKTCVKSLQKSGFAIVDHNRVEMAKDTVLSNNFQIIKDVREAGRVFYNAGNRYNDIVAWRIAFGEALEKFPEDSLLKDDALVWMTGRASDLSFNMKSQNSSFWRANPFTTIPTQFASYSTSMWESIFGLGTKGQRLTRPERSRLFLSQALLYGSYGVPLGPTILRSIDNKLLEGEDGKINNEWYKFLDSGMLDGLAYWVSNGEVSVTTGQSMSSLEYFRNVKRMVTEDGEFLETIGGPTFKVTKEFLKDTISALKLVYHGRNELDSVEPSDMLLQSFKEVLNDVSSYSYASRVYAALKTKEYVTSNGSRISDINDYETMMLTVFGSVPDKVPETYLQKDKLVDLKMDIGLARKKANNITVEFLRAHGEGDDRKAEVYAKQLQIFYATLRPEVYEAIKASQVNSSLEYDKVMEEALKYNGMTAKQKRIQSDEIKKYEKEQGKK